MPVSSTFCCGVSRTDSRKRSTSSRTPVRRPSRPLPLPAEMARRAGPPERRWHGGRPAHPRLELRLEALEAPFFQHVFQARELAIGAVPVVAMDRDDGLDSGVEALRLDGCERLRDARMRGLHTGAHAESAAHQDRETIAAGNDADVVRIDIDAVVPRRRDADLELPWQVRVAIERLVFWRPGLGGPRPP